MEHLNIDEINQLVSEKKLTKEFIELAAKVNGHIRNCSECMKIVRSYQMIYDEFERMGKEGSFRTYIDERLSEDKTGNEVRNETDEFDIDR